MSCHLKYKWKKKSDTNRRTGDVNYHLSVSLQKFDGGDSQLDSSELLKFIQQNESVAELHSYADQESNNLLRSVCGFACSHVKVF